MKKGLLLLTIPLLVACNQDEKCSDDFILDYQRMGDAFETLYKPKAGSFEVKNFDDTLATFLSKHKDVECKQGDKTLKPTTEVEELRKQIAAILSPEIKSLGMNKLVAKVIYGDDNRQQVADVAGVYQDWAGSTLAQISSNEWDSSFNYTSKTYGEEFTLCSGERFIDELSVSRCSGFLVAPDVVVTAGHCVQSQTDCDNYKWVLDFKDNAKKTDASKVFTCREIISQKLDDSNDYAVLKLDRAITNRKFFRVRTSGIVPQNTSLVMIGHPSGISTKVADGALVRDNTPKDFFVTNTDSFGGNSGSAVINRDSGIVEGILVRGDQDFDIIDGPDGNRCRVEKVCPNDGCEGEEVTKMTAVEGIPAIANVDVIRKGLYEDKNFPGLSEGLPLSFLGYSYGGYTIGGLKFLDRCGAHYYHNSDPNTWEEFAAGPCVQTRAVNDVITVFGNLFYF